MATNVTYMDVPAVRDMAKNFGTIGEVLIGVGKVLDTLSTTLKATAFMGLVGGAAVARYIDMIRPEVDKMAQKCAELNEDLTRSVDAYERGDAEGAARFH